MQRAVSLTMTSRGAGGLVPGILARPSVTLDSTLKPSEKKRNSGTPAKASLKPHEALMNCTRVQWTRRIDGEDMNILYPALGICFRADRERGFCPRIWIACMDPRQLVVEIGRPRRDHPKYSLCAAR